MAYNPVTHEILVSGYSSPDASNYGCIFRLDPDTLEQKERIQLSTSYNILGIDYLPSTGGYLIQTDADGGYGFKLLDASLQVVDDWGTYPFDFTWNFQDLCVSGDLFFLFPLTMHLGIGNFIQTYSLSQKTLLADDTVDFGFSDDITINEPEGLCETNPGEFIAIVNVTKADGDGTCSSTAPGCRICSRFPLPRRSMARCPRAGKFPAERKKPFPTRQTKASGSRSSRWTTCICR